MKAFDKLPEEFQNDEVRQYYDILSKKQASVIFKRAFDLFVSVILLIFLIIPIAVIAIAVKCDSKGPVMFRQERVTKYGRRFKIFKFRTMVVNAESLGTMVTTDSDSRVTRIGRKLRKYRLDELPQVFNVLSGSMTVVGTRPEVPKYVDMYEDKYYATLLLPAGITSLASIMYKDEEKLLASTEDADKVYVETILPEKMKYNLEYTEHFSFGSDVKLMFKTVKEVFS
ncbi:MAG: sugar transferase [Ruminococcus sp.]|uniref:sugar transferase n=1 Tax=Ruminococcus sp. JE7B6 TaxID=3233380 RepID=UPI0026F803AC|nr:sugar transferase [uncultured Ruminococcus sp.]MBQ1586636.1 sugar transferase [Ruminococcus sp.]MDO4892205.1 sugar transferase [Eubacteriales bacterium]MBQ1716649.1 sugar transferase [Ruminococcus sp.]MBQ2212029.1 sugar transferase [Ruminococcus sp.]MBQ2280256.1 sugar transferase [Ruminococcus sp.]